MRVVVQLVCVTGAVVLDVAASSVVVVVVEVAMWSTHDQCVRIDFAPTKRWLG